MSDRNILYSEHLKRLKKKAAEALLATGYEALILHSGSQTMFWRDDQAIPFRSNPYFAHWSPLAGPNHMLIVVPDERASLLEWVPEDFWEDHARSTDPFWEEHLAKDTRTTPAAIFASLTDNLLKKRVAFVGDESACRRAQDIGIAESNHNPVSLMHLLDEARTVKSTYEIEAMLQSNEHATKGHRVARDLFQDGASEIEIHRAYLAALGVTEAALPYGLITAKDQKASVLHYEGKHKEKGGRVLLIDGGAKHLGYDSDITRTWTTPQCDGRFRNMVAMLDALQRDLAAAVHPGIATIELHKRAHLGIAHILYEHGLVTAGANECIDLGITAAFFPHGLGHFLGLNTHDVGNSQTAAEAHPEKTRFPKLRTLRFLETGNVITIEPGIYFIPMLLDKLRVTEANTHLNWDLIAELSPCGGIRIEDDVLVTETGSRNMTREHLPE